MGGASSCCARASADSTPLQDRPKRYWHQVDENVPYEPCSTGGAAMAGVTGGAVNHMFPRDETSMNLQHISERETDEACHDPSTHPTARPLFMERSKSDMRIRESRRSFYVLDAFDSSRMRPLRKSNSCSTIFLDDSTISQPNLKNTIKCISLAIYYHVIHRKNRGCERTIDIFEEQAHPVSVSANAEVYSTTRLQRPVHNHNAVADLDHRTIYRFVRTLFHAAQLTAECAIITLVYVERLLNYAEMDMCGSNWRRCVLGAIMMASKVWDDQAVWNVDYCQILKDCHVDDMNELERQFLELLEFNINVPSSVYAKYYYDLRTLAMANDLQLPLQPLSKERADRLEALSMQYEDRLIGHDAKPTKTSKSNGTAAPVKRAKIVLLANGATPMNDRKWNSTERLPLDVALRRANVVIS